MADVVSSIVYVLNQEDARMSGVVTNDKRDAGGRTRWGIAERFHPELTTTGFFDSMNAVSSLALAKSVYDKTYANSLLLGSINSQQVANALLSFAVNEGVISSIKVAQDALGVNADGKFGPATLEAVNSTSTFLASLEAKQTAHYNVIVAANPIDRSFLGGWLNRVHQDCQAA